jgi:hypothetical protein
VWAAGQCALQLEDNVPSSSRVAIFARARIFGSYEIQSVCYEIQGVCYEIQGVCWAAVRYKAFSINAMQSSQGVGGSGSGFLTTAQGMAMRCRRNIPTPRPLSTRPALPHTRMRCKTRLRQRGLCWRQKDLWNLRAYVSDV